MDVVAFTDVVKEFDSMSRLVSLMIYLGFGNMILIIKKVQGICECHLRNWITHLNISLKVSRRVKYMIDIVHACWWGVYNTHELLEHPYISERWCGLFILCVHLLGTWLIKYSNHGDHSSCCSLILVWRKDIGGFYWETFRCNVWRVCSPILMFDAMDTGPMENHIAVASKECFED